MFVAEEDLGGRCTGRDAGVDVPLVEPALVGGVVCRRGRALHAVVERELGHEAFVGLGRGPGLADVGEGG